MSITTTSIAVPSQVSGEIIQKVQETSAIMSLAKYIDLPGLGATIPVIVGDPEAAWVEEGTKKPVSDPTLSKKVMGAYTLAVIVPFSNQFRNNMPALYNAIVERLPGALAKKYDATCFGNVSAPGSNFDTFASCTAQSFGTDPYAALVAADADVAAHNGITNGFVIAPQGKSLLLGATDANDRPLFINSVAEGAIPMILGAPTKQSKAAFKTVSGGNDIVGFAGDWTQALYGISQNLSLSISDQATLDLGSGNTINLWQQNMFAVRAEIEVGFVADTACFNKLTK